MITVEISEWSSLCREFKSFFIDLGHVMENGDFIQFKSFKENVATGFSISKKGAFAASMPLHGLEGKALTVDFDKVTHSINVHGLESKYTYRVPQELLNLRN